MTVSVIAASLADRLAAEIGSGRVVAALFSTFTFRREFFERVPLPLITAEGRRRGFLPITVAVDRTQFEGSGWGYEMVRAPGDRRWHAKLVALMLEQDGYQRTILAIGSGNLTRSGWERNLELFHLDAWWGWKLPTAVVAWLRTPWLRPSCFAKWTREVHVGTKRRHTQSVLGSLSEPLWGQVDLVRRGRRWSELEVVSPFGDMAGDDAESSDACGPFFDEVLDHAHANGARMTVYLRGVDEHGTSAYGDPDLLKRVGKRVSLRVRAVPSEDDRVLHAKLLAARTDGTWSVVLGSPNATGPAFVAPSGNVELACEFRRIGRALPAGLLPKSRSIGLDAVVRPERTDTNPRWECLESATYHPRRRKIVLQWKSGHGPFDSRILLEGRDLDPNDVDLGVVEDRFLKTLPIGVAKQRFEPDFVPIDVPDDEADILHDIAEDSMSADDWLARLDGAAMPDHEGTGGRGRGSSRRSGRHENAPRFHWRERVVTLDQKLRGLDKAISEASSKRDVDHLRKMTVGVWRAHDPDAAGLTLELRAWRRWVRGGICQVLNRFDKRIKLLRPLSSLEGRWRRTLPKVLKEFEIG